MKLKYHVLEEFLRCVNESYLKNVFILRGSLLTRQCLKTFRKAADLDFAARMGRKTTKAHWMSGKISTSFGGFLPSAILEQPPRFGMLWLF